MVYCSYYLFAKNSRVNADRSLSYMLTYSFLKRVYRLEDRRLVSFTKVCRERHVVVFHDISLAKIQDTMKLVVKQNAIFKEC